MAKTYGTFGRSMGPKARMLGWGHTERAHSSCLGFPLLPSNGYRFLGMLLC